MKKQLPLQALLSIIALLLLLISITVGTFAWFTFRTDVNVEPIAGTVGKTDGSLLISAAPEGPFDKECELRAFCPATGLKPLSTADLRHFYTAAMQNSEGRVIRFRNADRMVDECAIHGHVYLKATKEPANVYLNQAGLFFGTDIQALASMRLGMVVTIPGAASKTFLFQLDDMADVSRAAAHMTIADEYRGMVVGSAQGDSVHMTPDPAAALSRHWAVLTGPEEEPVVSVGTPMFALEPEVVADVEFWLYLEGCDIHCQNLVNGVQNRDAALSLAFYGEIIPQE